MRRLEDNARRQERCSNV